MSENPHAGQGSVALDIGGDVGALVVTMPAEMNGLEIEIRPLGAADGTPSPTRGDDHGHADGHSHDGASHGHHHGASHDHGVSPWPHVAVVTRPTPSGPVPSLVFGAVLEGRYELYVRPDGPVQLTVNVVGGSVAEAVWPTAGTEQA